MPVINGLEFPEPEFCEYPKVLYAGGALGGATLIVADAGEEQAAAPDFLPLGGSEVAVRREPADDDTAPYSRAECRYEVCPGAGECQAADTCLAAREGPDVATHENETGEPAAPTTGRRGSRKPGN